MIKICKPFCYSELGLRQKQEDTLYPPCGESTENTHVFMVCDGMGGHENGEIASDCVAKTIGEFTSRQPICTVVEMKNIFENALERAYYNLDLLDHSKSNKKMGTTLTFLAFCLDGVLVAHIGDSRVYQFRPGKGILFQTRDHSLVNELIAAGELIATEANTFPLRNVVTRAVQPHQETRTKATFEELTDIRKGDLFLLCCDGVLEQLDNIDLCRLLLNGKTLYERLMSLKEECKTRNTHDNNTAYLIEVADVECLDEGILLSVPQTDAYCLTLVAKIKKICCYLMVVVILLSLAFALIFVFGGLEKQKRIVKAKMGQIY